MRWTPLSKGKFTGIGWSRKGATDGADPYLVWADISGFADGGPGEIPAWLPILIELKKGCSIKGFANAASAQWLRMPNLYLSACMPSGLRYCTAYVRPRFFREIRQGGALHGMVERFECGLALDSKYLPAEPASYPVEIDAKDALQGQVIGVIDDGLAFADQRFLRQGKARTRFFWHQQPSRGDALPAGAGYGRELRAAAIDQAMARRTYRGMVDEGALYQDLRLPDLARRYSHGTHVADLACGPRSYPATVAGPHAPPSWAMADDPASRASLLAVQLNDKGLLDSSGGSINIGILDGLAYMLSRCDANASLCVNISWGTLAGPHDGSSVLEAAMDQLIALQRGRLHIVLPAGNSYQGRAHANATLARGQAMRLQWVLPAGDWTPSFLEIWTSPGAEGLEISVIPPGGHAALRALPQGTSRMLNDELNRAICALVYPDRVATGTSGTCALLALAPNFSFMPGVATAPSGVWTVEIVNRQAAPAIVDACIERDDQGLGHHRPAPQSYLVDELYDTSGNPGAWVDVPVAPAGQLGATLIRRSGTFNNIATGKRIVSVGGQRLSDASAARYSPRVPDPDRSRPQRPGVRRVPNRLAASDENLALGGVRAAGTRSASAVRLVGTSSAAPQITREIFNGLAAAPPRAAGRYQRAGRALRSTMRRSSKAR